MEKSSKYSEFLYQDMQAAWYAVMSSFQKPYNPQDPRQSAIDAEHHKDVVSAFLITWRRWKRSLVE